MDSMRRAAVVLSAVLLAWPVAVVLAQRGPIIVPTPPVAPPTGRIDEADFVRTTDPRLAVKLKAAAEYIHDQEWDKAVRMLQQLLDLDGDPTTVIGDDKQPRTVSARAEAQRLLASLPPEGRKEYQQRMGPSADEALKEAIKDKDDEKLASVIRRFLSTDAGPKALEALAELHDDAGRYRLAALSYRRLLERRDAAQWPLEGLFRAADAFHRGGDQAQADVAAKQLLDRMGDKELAIGDRKLRRDEVRRELSKPIEAKTDWPMFGGAPGRSAQGDGGMPFLWRDWEYSTTVFFEVGMDGNQGAKLMALFQKASDSLEQIHQPLLPSQFPVVVPITSRIDGKKRPVVVCITHSGIAVRDVTGGRLMGVSSTEGSFDWMMSDRSRGSALNQWTQAYINQYQRPGVVFENTVIGTLSIDGDIAYAVADLAVPPAPLGANMFGKPAEWTGEISDSIKHNRLMAFDLSAGCKNLWPEEVFTDPKSELADSIFLGPPLPLDGRLFVLTEKDRNLRLLCLENVPGKAKGNWNPRVVYVLPLGTVPDELSAAAYPRRVHAAPIAYGDGVLVCPTHAGCVVGVDLLTRSIAWVHRYERTAPLGIPPGARLLPSGVILTPNGQQLSPSWAPQGWCSSAPVVSNGAVVFAAPDGFALTCLDLKTGALRWQEPRQDDDLYFAGVFDGRVLVVGKKACRAVNLSDGKPAWSLATGVPSGRGAAAGGVYYLPLRDTESSKQPEVCAIDVAKGRIVGRARPHVPAGRNERQGPFGNLVFAEGVMISQTTKSIAAYPLLKTKLDEINEALSKNPDNPEGLLERAELRLQQGNAVGAVEDLHKVIDQKPSAPLLKRTQDVLYPALTQLLQTDFAKGEKYLPEYDALGHISNDAIEALHRRAGLYLLVGRGFEGEGKLKEALNAYEKLGGLGDEPLLPVPDDPSLRASPSALGRAGVAELLRKAPAEKRKELEEEIRRVLDKAKEAKTKPDLRSFIDAFGADTGAGREARLELAERLIETRGGGQEAEILLEQVASGDDADQAARAVEAQARLSMKLGLLEDALYYYGVLNRDYGTIKVHDGKTGAELYQAVQTDKRFLSLLEKPKPFEGDHFRAIEERGAFPDAAPGFQFPVADDATPFFQRFRLRLLYDKNQLQLVDRATGEGRWGPLAVRPTILKDLTTLVFQGPALLVAPPTEHRPAAPPVFAARTLGRLAVLPAGDRVIGVDGAVGKVIWNLDLFHSGTQWTPLPPVQSRETDARSGDLLVSYVDGWRQRLGPGALVLTPSALCLMMRDGLTAFDPFTGQVLWRRNDVAPAARLFGDGARLFVVESVDGQAVRTRVLRIADGSVVPAPDFRDAYNASLSASGRGLLTAESGKDGLTLRLYDLAAAKDVWKETYPAKSIALTSLAPDLAGTVDPTGKVRVVDLRSLKEVFTGTVNPKHLAQAESVYLLTDGKLVYIACDSVPAEGRSMTDLAQGTGLRDLPVNGEFYAFDAATGKLRWRFGAANQRLLLSDFADLPVIVFAGRRNRNRNLFQEPNWETAVSVHKKATGKRLIDRDLSPLGDPFHTLFVDPAGGRIELISSQEKIAIEEEARK